eukprot:TRINITY_DN6000_c1_g1_i9.p2 TRINITY_DN6000_c1_g1~~TRINITY_DN6000_c1_g1_i9.p2  ORF type:complete len:189 (-),score=-6.96 TRINITY_DN6000_c1_g1_i9:64-630(-)
MFLNETFDKFLSTSSLQPTQGHKLIRLVRVWQEFQYTEIKYREKNTGSYCLVDFNEQNDYFMLILLIIMHSYIRVSNFLFVQVLEMVARSKLECQQNCIFGSKYLKTMQFEQRFKVVQLVFPIKVLQSFFLLFQGIVQVLEQLKVFEQKVGNLELYFQLFVFLLVYFWMCLIWQYQAIEYRFSFVVHL